MLKILLIPYAPQLGTFYGLIDIAYFLEKNGHRIFIAGEGKFLKLLENDFENSFALPEIPFNKYREKVDSGSLGIHTYESAKFFIKEELALYEKIKPDLVITQGRVTVPVSTKIAKIPSISITVPVLTEYYNYPKKIPESLSIAFLSKIPLVSKIVGDNMGNYFKLMAKIWIKPFNKIAKDYNIERFKSFYDLYKGSFLTLIPELETIFPLNEEYKKDNFHYCGPLLHWKHYPLPKWYNNARLKRGKCIYLSMGSSSIELYPILLNKLIRIFGNKPGYKVITNTTYTTSEFSENIVIPKNFFITDIAPAQKMLEIADITICHGGKGTLYDSLIGNVPILGIPQQAEQEMNLIRIKELGVGDYILANKIKTISDQEFKKTIDTILHNRLMKNEIRRVSKNVRKSMKRIDETVNLIHNKLSTRHNKHDV